MDGLFLGHASGVLLEIASFRDFDEGLCVLWRGRLVGEGRLKLSVDDNVGVSTDRGGKVGIQRDIQSVVTELLLWCLASNNVFRSLHRLDK
jgi:hypothetical protein